MLAVFSCREVHGTWYLEADLDIKCYTPEHATYQSLASLGVLLYPIGIPLSFLVLMLKCVASSEKRSRKNENPAHTRVVGRRPAPV